MPTISVDKIIADYNTEILKDDALHKQYYNDEGKLKPEVVPVKGPSIIDLTMQNKLLTKTDTIIQEQEQMNETLTQINKMTAKNEPGTLMRVSTLVFYGVVTLAMIVQIVSIIYNIVQSS